MRRYSTPALLILVIGAIVMLPGCFRQQSTTDKADIETTVGTSDYTNDNNSGAIDDEATAPVRDVDAPGSIPGPLDTLPWVRFVRRIDRPVARTVSIAIPAYPGYPETTALATITANPSGRFYVQNDRGSHVAWVKDIDDSGVRKVYLTKHDDTWRIRELTPWNLGTRNAQSAIQITAIKLEARPSGLSYLYTSPDSLMNKNDLPAFLPGDTVRVTVTVESDSATWAFLHRGVRGHHVRRAFFRDSPDHFVREWVVRDDSIPQVPAVRPAAIDIIGYSTLFGDSLAPYNSRSWTLPYVMVSTPTGDRPE